MSLLRRTAIILVLVLVPYARDAHALLPYVLELARARAGRTRGAYARRLPWHAHAAWRAWHAYCAPGVRYNRRLAPGACKCGTRKQS